MHSETLQSSDCDASVSVFERHSSDVLRMSSFFELPLLPTHGALLLDLLGVEPFEDAVHVEAVGALAPDQWAVISRNLTVWAAAIKRHSADPTVLIIGHPQPGCHAVPLLDFNLHLP